MRGFIRLCVTLILVSLVFYSCGGSGHLLKKVPPTINTVKPRNGYVKQVAAVLIQTPLTTVGQRAGALYFKTLVKSVSEEDSRSRVETPEDSGFPKIMKPFSGGSISDLDVAILTRGARQVGYQGVLVVAVRDIRVDTIRTGFFWFRKKRYIVQFTVTADLYDPYLRAKVVSGVMESSTKISIDDYEGFQNGTISAIEKLDEGMVDAAEELGEQVGEALSDLMWKAAVTKVDGDRVVLAVGSDVGLKEGERFVVFQGGRLLDGKQGQQFVAPGYQVGTLQVSDVTDRTAEAKATPAGKVKNGDIVVPVR
ncbi:MAG: hypothetical protein P8X96_00935 [Desulfobacteraceae bacterium]